MEQIAQALETFKSIAVAALAGTVPAAVGSALGPALLALSSEAAKRAQGGLTVSIDGWADPDGEGPFPRAQVHVVLRAELHAGELVWLPGAVTVERSKG